MSRSTHPTARRHGRAGAALGLLLALLVGCSGGGGSAETMTAGDSSGGSVGAPAPAARESVDKGFAGTVGDSYTAQQGANRPTVQARAVIRRGELWLVSKDVPAARARIDHVVGRYGGLVAQEESTNSSRGRTSSTTIVLRFPEPEFDTVMRELAQVARVRSTTRNSEDVTTTVIDVDTRVATQEASLRRLQRFLREATDIDAIIRLESEIATRQAALESLKAQQQYLRDQTALSTVTVHLSAVDRPTPPPEPEDDLGFLVGLTGGWEALRAVLLTVATIAGALVPFVFTLAIVGVPVWLLVRGLTRRHRGSAGPATPSGSGPAPDAEA